MGADDPIYHLSPTLWILALVCAFLIGFSKSGIAGTGVLAIPLMATIFPAGKSTGILLPILIVGDIFSLFYYRRHAVWTHVLRALPWAVVGILFGWGSIHWFRLDDEFIKKMIGVIVVAVLGMGEWFGRRKDALEIPKRWWFSATLGLLAGFTTMVANAAGPVWQVYLLSMGLPKEAFLGTGAWMFFILNSFKVPFSWELGFITPESIFFNAKMVPAVALGAFLGVKAAKRIPQRAFDLSVKFLTLLAAINLLFGREIAALWK